MYVTSAMIIHALILSGVSDSDAMSASTAHTEGVLTAVSALSTNSAHTGVLTAHTVCTPPLESPKYRHQQCSVEAMMKLYLGLFVLLALSSASVMGQESTKKVGLNKICLTKEGLGRKHI